MTSADVLAVVVSYNGRDKTRAAVDALLGQVGEVLVVDNGSDPESLTVLAELERTPGVVVVRLGENRGVGHALNVGVAHARRRGFAWLLTMDQDSVVDADMVEAYARVVERRPTVASLAPTTTDGEARSEAPSREEYAITSGHLVRVDVFDQVGPFDEGLFVDCVDFDFSLRLRKAGHALHRVPDARMRHRVGHAVEAPGLVRRFYTLHPPIRRYYQFRNYFYIAERHVRRFPGFVIKLGVVQLLLLVLMGFYDPNPLDSYRAALRGLRDYLARVEGPAPGGA